MGYARWCSAGTDSEKHEVHVTNVGIPGKTWVQQPAGNGVVYWSKGSKLMKRQWKELSEPRKHPMQGKETLSTNQRQGAIPKEETLVVSIAVFVVVVTLDVHRHKCCY